MYLSSFDKLNSVSMHITRQVLSCIFPSVSVIVPAMYLQLKLEEVGSGQQYVFEAKRWLRMDQDRDYWREFPVYAAQENDMLPGEWSS